MADDLSALHDKADRILAMVGNIADDRLKDHERMNRLETVVGEVSAKVDLLTTQTPARLPMPSLTSEERRAQTESIRVASEKIGGATEQIGGMTNALTEISTVIAGHVRTSKWLPIVILVATGVGAFCAKLIQELLK